MRSKTSQITMDALLAAMCAVLGGISLDLGVSKVSFESLPVLMAGFMFGPADGMLVGFIGTLIYQVMRYGLSATTLLWILPYVVCGLLTGSIAKRSNFNNTGRQILVIVIIAELAVTVLNSFVIFIDSKVYGYYYKGIVFGMIAWRVIMCVVKSVVFGLVLPGLLKTLSVFTGNGRKRPEA